MKKGIITITIILVSIGGLIYWRTIPHIYHIPGATITVVDEDTGKPIQNVLTEITWGAMNFEGLTLKKEWKLTDQRGTVEIDPLVRFLWVSRFDSLVVGFIQPLYKGNAWHLTVGLKKKEQLKLSVPNPPKQVTIVKLKSLDKLLSNIDSCKEEEKKDRRFTPRKPNHLDLIGNYSRYYSALYRSKLSDPLNKELIQKKAIEILTKTLNKCPEKLKTYIEILKRK